MMTDVTELITENLDIWTTSVQKKNGVGRGSSKKLDLYGVNKLRELILELAVKGKLVPQNPEDEPASVLLERIKPEKDRIIQDGKFKELQNVEKSNELHSIPGSWTWCQLGDIAAIARGGSPRPIKSFLTDDSNGINWIKIGDSIRGSRYITNTKEKIIPEGIKKSRQVFPGDLILSNSMSFGYPYILDISGCIHDGWLVIRIPEHMVDKIYLYNMFLSPYVKKALSSVSAGAVVQNLNADKVKALQIPFPPLQEQHRIVEKVDELMALCDILEQQTEESIDAHRTLVETLLSTLIQSQNAEELEQNWNRISHHFDILFSTEESIDLLKQTILQLAVMGKLVPQNPEDEPVSILLEKIAAEKAQLVKDKKIKKQKALPEITEEEKPFDLPNGWEWNRFQKIYLDLKYGTSKKSDYTIKGVPILRIPNVVKGYVDTNDLKFSELTDKEQNDLQLNPGDLLLIRSNGSTSIVGRAAVVDKNYESIAYAGYLVRARINTDYYNSKFIKIVLDSTLIRNQIELPIRTTSGVKNINSMEIGQLIMPCVPLGEQWRIVKKVDELNELCDRLRNNISSSQNTQQLLSDAVVKQVLKK